MQDFPCSPIPHIDWHDYWYAFPEATNREQDIMKAVADFSVQYAKGSTAYLTRVREGSSVVDNESFKLALKVSTESEE